MAVIIHQTGTAAACSPASHCSGALLNSDGDLSQDCTEGGASGPAETVTVNASAADLASGWFQWDVPADYEWAAGTWTVRLNVTTAQANVSWDATYICRVNSGCTNQATIGSVTGQATSLGTTGVKTHTVSGSAQTPNAGDRAIVILLFDNSNSCNRNVGLTPDQDIDTPFNAPAPSFDGAVFGTTSMSLCGCGR